MNTRRSFFKSLALIGAAAAGCPGIFIPKFEPVRWKVRRWQASYGYQIINMPPLFDAAILEGWTENAHFASAHDALHNPAAKPMIFKPSDYAGQVVYHAQKS